jgi:hypothetical protein
MTLPADRPLGLEPTPTPGCRYCADLYVSREWNRQRGAMGLVRARNLEMARHPHGPGERPADGRTAPWEK